MTHPCSAPDAVKPDVGDKVKQTSGSLQYESVTTKEQYLFTVVHLNTLQVLQATEQGVYLEGRERFLCAQLM